jgi:multiple sugar transport system permease protein
MARYKIFKYILLLLLGFAWLLPLASMFLFSFAPNSDIIRMRLLPSKVTLDNYYAVFTTEIRGVSIPKALLNSLVVLVIQVTGILALDAPAAYALARLNFWGRETIFRLILITMMMPGHIILISLYVLMASVGLVDTLPGLFLPGLPRVIGIFLLRQFFKELPQEIEDAAYIDGANEWQTFIKIMLPMASPALATLTVITVLYSWNNFLWPLVILNSPEKLTVPIAVAYLRAGTNVSQNYSILLSASFLTSLPMILLFIFAQKWIVKGVAPTSGIK